MSDCTVRKPYYSRPIARSRMYYVDCRELTCSKCGYVTQPPAEWADTGDVHEDVKRMQSSEELARYCSHCGSQFDPVARRAIEADIDPSEWVSYWDD